MLLQTLLLLLLLLATTAATAAVPGPGTEYFSIFPRTEQGQLVQRMAISALRVFPYINKGGLGGGRCEARRYNYNTCVTLETKGAGEINKKQVG